MNILQNPNLFTKPQHARVARIILAVSAITMFVLSAGAPGRPGW